MAGRRAGGRRLEHVEVAAADPHRFASLLTSADYRDLLALIEAAAVELHGRVIWNVNSTARGGGVAELLQGLISYARGAGTDARWVVIRGEPSFFEVTKRLHNHLHGFDGERPPEAVERRVYARTMAANARRLVPLIRPDDVVILHDPQTAGLSEAVRGTGATVIWRCHVGMDHANEVARSAWSFLLPYVAHADAYVFHRASFAWEGLDSARIAVIEPSIDTFSPKNQSQTPEESVAILTRAALLAAAGAGPATFTRADGTPGRVDRRAEVLELAPLAVGDRVIAQVSRWDRLKDHLGVLRAFAEHVPPDPSVHLLLAGPASAAVADDPEGAGVYAEIAQAWRELPEATRRRIHLASLPMIDSEENAAIVNALQRHADVVVQKSLAEGFGLTVAEAMWKGRAVVASRIGGIQDQIVDGESGILIPDPRDLAGFGTAVSGLLDNPDRAARIGIAARERVREHFLAPHHLRRYFELIDQLVRGYLLVGDA